MLTNKENDIVFLLSQGLVNKDIGNKLGIKTNTVKNHLTSVFKKTNTNNRVQLLLWYLNER